MPYLDVNGTRLHYEERGEGPPVVLVHGVWMSGRFFSRQLSALSREHRVISLDLRGHGRSDEVHLGHTLPAYARDLHAAIAELGLRDVVLLGWSMGAFVVWEYLDQFGEENVAATVIVDESATDYKWPDWDYGFADLGELATIMAAVQEDREPFVRGFIPAMFKEEPREEDVAWMLEEITRPAESVASAILFDQTVRDYRPVVSRIGVPTLLCFGRDEKLFPVAAGEDLAQRISDSRLVVFEESGHCPFLEEPDRFNAEVERFIESLPREGAHAAAR